MLQIRQLTILPPSAWGWAEGALLQRIIDQFYATLDGGKIGDSPAVGLFTTHFLQQIARNQLAVTYPMNSYNTRRGADYSIDQLSRFIDSGVREKMQRVVLDAPGDVPPPAPERPGVPKMDLFELLRGRFAPPPNARNGIQD